MVLSLSFWRHSSAVLLAVRWHDNCDSAIGYGGLISTSIYMHHFGSKISRNASNADSWRGRHPVSIIRYRRAYIKPRHSAFSHKLMLDYSFFHFGYFPMLSCITVGQYQQWIMCWSMPEDGLPRRRIILVTKCAVCCFIVQHNDVGRQNRQVAAASSPAAIKGSRASCIG